MKTLMVLQCFLLTMGIFDAGSTNTVLLGLLLLMATTLSIQILAPHGRVRGQQPVVPVEAEQGVQDHEANHEAPVSETRLDDESFLLKEEI